MYYVTLTCCTKSLLRQKLTWRFRLSMGHFCWAAGNIFTQHNASCKLEQHCSFGLKFNVPVDFQTFLDFEKINKQSALGYFNYVFENNSRKGLIEQNTRKFNILKLLRDFRHLHKLSLKCIVFSVSKGRRQY